jgi:hypothetical protein
LERRQGFFKSFATFVTTVWTHSISAVKDAVRNRVGTVIDPAEHEAGLVAKRFGAAAGGGLLQRAEAGQRDNR